MRVKLSGLVPLALCALLLTVGPSHAQTGQAADQSESVTVTGQLDPATLSTEIRRFVRGHARLTIIDQLARWHDPVCPRVIGLTQAYGDFIVNRIKAVAHEAGAPTNDAPGCTANITIIFTAEPQAVLDWVRSERPELLGYHFVGQRDAVATMTRPIQAWHATATGNDYVRAIDEPMRDPPTGQLGSRLSTGLESMFVHVLIVVNHSEIADAPIGPVSDYIALLALTDVRDETWSCGGLVTIMEHFSTCGEAPQELTTPDRAFLQGLYLMRPDAVLSLERAQIAREMREAITSEAEGAAAPE